MINKHKTN
jgi:hypothetical protein